MKEEDNLSDYRKHLENFNPEELKELDERETRWKLDREKMNDFSDRTEDFKNRYQSQRKEFVRWLDEELIKLPTAKGKLQLLTDQENLIHQWIKEFDFDISGSIVTNYQDLLDKVITPWKIRLTKTLVLESRIASFLWARKNMVKIPVSEMKPKMELIPKPNTSHLAVVEKKENLVPVQEKKKNSEGKKFEWSDARIPELLAELFFQRDCIFENQKKLMVEFLTKGSCPTHIAWRKKGNILTTVFYDVERTLYLKALKDYIAERIEQNIFSSSDTLKPISTKETIKASFSPGSVKKRAFKDDPDYLDVISYLKEKLQSPS